MIRNIMLILLITSFGLVACADLVAFKKRDNKTDNSSGRPNDNGTADGGSTKDDFYLDETPPEVVGDTVIVTDAMLRPFDPNKYKSPYNYQIVGNTILIDNGSKAYVDPSLSQTDDCSSAFYSSLTEEKFEYNNKVYLTNRKHINEFSKIFHGQYGFSHAERTYILAKDIDLCKSEGVPAFIPIGRPVTGLATFFVSKFDGDNHIIKNLYIKYDTTDSYNCTGFICGLLASYSGGSLQTIGVEGNIDITAVWQKENVGHGAGLVGFSVGGDVKNVVSNININGIKNVGGIVGMTTTGESGDGYAKPATIINAKNYGKVKGRENVGGGIRFC